MSKKSKKKPQATTAVAAAVNAVAVEPDAPPEAAVPLGGHAGIGSSAH
ncbi:hypothetical protein [Acidovorax sp. KKS102]|nr:hypothetical protein [Acidovorax sp. KKS102]